MMGVGLTYGDGSVERFIRPFAGDNGTGSEESFRPILRQPLLHVIVNQLQLISINSQPRLTQQPIHKTTASSMHIHVLLWTQHCCPSSFTLFNEVGNSSMSGVGLRQNLAGISACFQLCLEAVALYKYIVYIIH